MCAVIMVLKLYNNDEVEVNYSFLVLIDTLHSRYIYSMEYSAINCMVNVLHDEYNLLHECMKYYCNIAMNNSIFIVLLCNKILLLLLLLLIALLLLLI